MAKAVSGAALYINNEIVPYEPETLIISKGNPEAKQSPQVVGNGRTENVYSRDYSTAFGEIKFDLRSTSDNDNLVDDWIALEDAIAVRVVYPDGVTAIFESAAVTNKIEVDTGNDGMISVEMQSEPAVTA